MRVLIVATPTGAHPAGAFAAAVADAWRSWNRADALNLALLPHEGRGLLAALPGFTSTVVTAARRGNTHVLDGSLLLGGQDFHTGSTAPLAPALVEAVEEGSGEVVVGLGQLPVHDGGQGLLDQLSARYGTLAAARAAFADTRLVLAAASGVPLLGLHGAGADLVEQVGAEAAQQREREIGAWADGIEREYAPVDLATGRPLRLSGMPGSGMGGGAGFGLLVLGARMELAHEWVASRVDLAERVHVSDLVVVVIESLDGGTLEDSAVSVAAAQALESAVPLIVLAGEDMSARQSRARAGVVGVYEVGNTFTPAGVEQLARRVARTWSRPEGL